MNTTNYEKTYSSVSMAEKSVEHLEEVVNFLKQQTEPLSCAEIGKNLWGSSYSNKSRYASGIIPPAKLSQVLRHLCMGGFVKVEEINGEPVIIGDREWVYLTSDGEPIYQYITVYDKNGKEYKINNPEFCRCHYGDKGRWETVTKTIIPRIKVYSWVRN